MDCRRDIESVNVGKCDIKRCYADFEFVLTLAHLINKMPTCRYALREKKYSYNVNTRFVRTQLSIYLLVIIYANIIFQYFHNNIILSQVFSGRSMEV